MRKTVDGGGDVFMVISGILIVAVSVVLFYG